eukprot:scaffold7601_cov267-Pinguiococcus_pyrenoidosus.AAC.11
MIDLQAPPQTPLASARAQSNLAAPWGQPRCGNVPDARDSRPGHLSLHRLLLEGHAERGPEGDARGQQPQKDHCSSAVHVGTTREPAQPRTAKTSHRGVEEQLTRWFNASPRRMRARGFGRRDEDWLLSLEAWLSSAERLGRMGRTTAGWFASFGRSGGMMRGRSRKGFQAAVRDPSAGTSLHGSRAPAFAQQLAADGQGRQRTTPPKAIALLSATSSHARRGNGNLQHLLDQAVHELLAVSRCSSFREGVELLAEAAPRRRQLEGPEEVVGDLEIGAHGVDLVDEILDAVDAVLSQRAGDHGVLAQGDALAVDLPKATLVDELPHRLEVRVARQHLARGAREAQEHAIVDLSEAQKLQDLADLLTHEVAMRSGPRKGWRNIDDDDVPHKRLRRGEGRFGQASHLGRHADDTSDADHKGQRGLRLHVDATLVLGLAPEANELRLLRLVLLNVLLRAFRDRLQSAKASVLRCSPARIRPRPSCNPSIAGAPQSNRLTKPSKAESSPSFMRRPGEENPRYLSLRLVRLPPLGVRYPRGLRDGLGRTLLLQHALRDRHRWLFQTAVAVTSRGESSETDLLTSHLLPKFAPSLWRTVSKVKRIGASAKSEKYTKAIGPGLSGPESFLEPYGRKDDEVSTEQRQSPAEPPPPGPQAPLQGRLPGESLA